MMTKSLFSDPSLPDAKTEHSQTEDLEFTIDAAMDVILARPKADRPGDAPRAR